MTDDESQSGGLRHRAKPSSESAINPLNSPKVSRWQNYTLRLIFGLTMLAGFAFCVRAGPIALTLVILTIQIKCYYEIISIGHYVYKADNLPLFRLLSWYFLFASNVYFFGESFTEHFSVILARNNFGQSFLTYHTLISFILYTAGFVTFVLQLRRRFYLKQLSLFSLTHISLMLIVIQSNLCMRCLLEGIIWLLLPALLTICNDVFAYFCGFFFGKTPLIKLSPKKTWEGFIGGAVFTVVLGFFASGYLCQFNYLICPVQNIQTNEQCIPSRIFQLQTYDLPAVFAYIGKSQVNIYPFQLHAISLALFASILGPFGGFFASGFKRAFKIKDFSDTIPGHGGFMDRFDCQYAMFTFTYVWILTFVRNASPRRLLKMFMSMDQENKQEFLNMIKPLL